MNNADIEVNAPKQKLYCFKVPLRYLYFLHT